jgi:hypothetical protein
MTDAWIVVQYKNGEPTGYAVAAATHMDAQATARRLSQMRVGHPDYTYRAHRVLPGGKVS